MKKLTWALLSLMLFLGLGVAFAQGDMPGLGGGGDDVAISVPTLNPASGFVEPGAKIDATFAKEMVEALGPFGSLSCICVIYVENDENTTLETSMDDLGPFLDMLTAEEGEEIETPDLDYKVAIYAMNNDEDYAPEDP
ncbi:MAG: hypothetical protein K2H62_02750 [Bacteroidales bacterium]|nr:hypothetical protein [Bacteroidales bacterium]